jgi:hypothetical protein
MSGAGKQFAGSSFCISEFCTVLCYGQHCRPRHHHVCEGKFMKTNDEDASKGAVEQDRRDQETNVSLTGQNGHRDQDPLLKSANSDYPEPGQNEEHTGEPHADNELNRDTEGCTPGVRQKQNQNKSKDDPLAA